MVPPQILNSPAATALLLVSSSHSWNDELTAIRELPGSAPLAVRDDAKCSGFCRTRGPIAELHALS